ncbi:MAG TPA: YebC/PmpR family DNA-binding transcriptional regulator, partial [Armatimonadota bacterium]|nr:YebC/PmpR family DNA-binding transcriptional regulator [Armatimonadota bacterium]
RALFDVAWMFEKKGVITLEANGKDPDELALELIDAGADDVRVDGNEVDAYTAPEQLKALKDALEKRKIPITSAEIAWISKNPASVSDDQAVQTMKLMEALEEHDDVQKVFTNLDISDAVMTKFENAKEHA